MINRKLCIGSESDFSRRELYIMGKIGDSVNLCTFLYRSILNTKNIYDIHDNICIHYVGGIDLKEINTLSQNTGDINGNMDNA